MKADFRLPFTASVRSQSLDQPLVPGVFPLKITSKDNLKIGIQFEQMCHMTSKENAQVVILLRRLMYYIT